MGQSHRQTVGADTRCTRHRSRYRPSGRALAGAPHRPCGEKSGGVEYGGVPIAEVLFAALKPVLSYKENKALVASGERDAVKV